MAQVMYDAIFLSPHYDDVALSCGGTVHKLSKSGKKVLVLTVFSSPPDNDLPLSDFALSIHKNMGAMEGLTKIRQAEDKKAMGILKCQSSYLPFKDCIYRGTPSSDTYTKWFYTSFAALLGDIQVEEYPLINEIADYLTSHWIYSKKPTIYAPLAVGNHVDHQLVFRAACLLKKRGYCVKFYADYPYCDPNFSWNKDNINPMPLAKVLVQSADHIMDSHKEILSQNNLTARVDAIAAYSSQTPFIFSTWGDMKQIVTNYSDSLSEYGSAEQFWF